MKKALAAALCGVLFTATMTVPVLADDADYAGMKIVLILPGSIDDQSWNASKNVTRSLAPPSKLLNPFR